MAHEAAFRNALVQAFGKKRFTMRDLWHERPGSRAWPHLWEGFPAADRLPDSAWAERMRRELARLAGVEPVPGPRGGEGWRVLPAVAEQFISQRENSATSRTQRNAPYRTAAANLSSRFAIVTLDETVQQVRARYPDIELAPNREWGLLRPISAGTVVLKWCRAHRYVGLEVHGETGVITCDWQYSNKLARALTQLDEVVACQIEATARHYEKRLAALEPYRTVTVKSDR